MNAEFVRRGAGVLILIASSLYIKAVGIEKARLSRWTWAAGFILTLA